MTLMLASGREADRVSRDTQGRVGVRYHAAPPRCASLFLGRNEEGGSAASSCGRQPVRQLHRHASVPPHQEVSSTRLKAKAYPVRRAARGLWVYMGSSASAAVPAFESSTFPMTKQRHLISGRMQLPPGARGLDRYLHFRFLQRLPRRPARRALGLSGLPHDHHRSRIPSRRILPPGARVTRANLAVVYLICTYFLFANFLFSRSGARHQWRVRHSRACALLGAARHGQHHVLLPAVERGYRR